ncbi:4Fe-4S dicluster domain-containing protein [Caldivirga sp.]|nr:4Fe-4S dicluster domain-containing protein [Caldivirga sp.]
MVLNNCTGCGICWTICPKGVLVGKLKDKAMVVSEGQCMGCFSCQYNCPYNAIIVQVKVAEGRQ